MKIKFCVFLIVSIASLITGNLISQPSFAQTEKDFAQREKEKFLEVGEEKFREDCYNQFYFDNSSGEYPEGSNPEDVITNTCEGMIDKIKNQTGTSEQYNVPLNFSLKGKSDGDDKNASSTEGGKDVTVTLKNQTGTSEQFNVPLNFSLKGKSDGDDKNASSTEGGKDVTVTLKNQTGTSTKEQQVNNNSTVRKSMFDRGKSMVDKLLEDTQKGEQIAQSYRAELINRIENSTCLEFPREYGVNHTEEELKEYDRALRSEWNASAIWMDIPELESKFKFCAAEGKIK
jgi:hypothetical protein